MPFPNFKLLFTPFAENSPFIEYVWSDSLPACIFLSKSLKLAEPEPSPFYLHLES